MTGAGELLPLCAGVIAAMMLALWSASLALRDASIVDMFWGLGFVIVAWVSFAVGDGWEPRSLLLSALVSLWGLRLSIHIARRNWGKGEDFRYQSMRRRWGDRFWLVSLGTVFALQGMFMFIVSLPVQLGQLHETPDHITVLDLAGTLVFAVGFFFEAVGDVQLDRFKADSRNKRQVLDTGLWRYTRHPNYFGDATQWFGFYLIASSYTGYAWTIISPALMAFLLMRVSGVPMLERSMAKRRPAYADYMSRTSAFLPRPPHRQPGSQAAPR